MSTVFTKVEQEIPETELILSNILNPPKQDPVKLAIANAANKLRRKSGLVELSLAFFEESEHPRGRGGQFISKGRGGDFLEGDYDNNFGGGDGGGRYGQYNGEPYDREEIHKAIRDEDERPHREAAAKLHEFLKVSLVAGGAVLASVTGHPIIAAILGGYVGAKVGIALVKATSYAIAKYGTKAVVGTGKLVASPFTAMGRGLYDAATE